MNGDEIQEIRKTWEIPMKNPKDSGAEILTRFFTKYPSNLQKFASFRDCPIPELKNNARFKAHCSRIIFVFDQSIKTLGNDDSSAELHKIWTNVGTSHFARRIEKQAYLELREAIVEVLAGVCNFTDEQRACWEKLIDYVYGIIFGTIDKLSNEGQ